MLDLIVPVFKGLQQTQECLTSIIHAPTKTAYELIVINDASPDAQITAYLRYLSANKQITLIENTVNLGFVATVNQGMALHPDRDVVLLNSDTVVANDWLDRLQACAESNKHIATVTPFSNNATICSYPHFCQVNALPPGKNVGEIDEILKRTHAGKIVDIPTAVGFCMYIKRAVLEQIGLFDVENFGKGYGEENDFCMRAHAKSWRNVVACDTFVYHVGSVSFGETQQARIEHAMQTMQKLHPDYLPRVHKFIQNDPLKTVRQAIDWHLLCADKKTTVLCIDHGQTGGTIKHIYELAHLFHTQANFLRLYPGVNGLTQLSWLDANQAFLYAERKELLNLYFKLPEEMPVLITILKTIGVQHIHYHHTMGLDPIVWGLPESLGLKYDYTLHDYYALCPQITLTTMDYHYCYEPGETSCNTCLESRPTPGRVDIKVWRNNYHKLLKNAHRVFAPSQDVAERMRRYFQDLPLVIAPHSDMEHSPSPVTPLPQLSPAEPLCIAVIGALSPIKGPDLLEKCALYAKQQRLPIEFHLFGTAYRSLAIHPKSHLFQRGVYANDLELVDKLSAVSPHLIWFPAQWPETYSYTLSVALQIGLPVATTEIGAFSERIAGRPYSWNLPISTTAEEWNEFFCCLQQGRLPETAPYRAKPDEAFLYHKDYLPAPPRLRSITPSSYDTLLPYTKPYRSPPQRLRRSIKKMILDMIITSYKINFIRATITRSISLTMRDRMNKWLEK